MATEKPTDVGAWNKAIQRQRAKQKKLLEETPDVDADEWEERTKNDAGYMTANRAAARDDERKRKALENLRRKGE